MPALKNPRHELFAQELAKGKPAYKAHATAGLSGDRGDASKLQRKPNIVQRVEEIMLAHEEVDRAATERAIDALGIDREFVMRALKENHEKAQAASDFGPSNKALELLGKELGLFKDRVVHSGNVTVEVVNF